MCLPRFFAVDMLAATAVAFEIILSIAIFTFELKNNVSWLSI